MVNCPKCGWEIEKPEPGGSVSVPPCCPICNSKLTVAAVGEEKMEYTYEPRDEDDNLQPA